MWEIRRMHDSPSPALLGHYSSGNIRVWMHGSQRLVYLLNNLGSWVAFSVMQQGRLTVCRRWLGVHSPHAFFTISASLLTSHFIPAHLTGWNTQMPFVYSSVSLHTHMQILMVPPCVPHTHKPTLQPIFIQRNWLFHTCMISIPPLYPISMLMKLWIYSINASKHTGVRAAYYITADEWLHGFYHAIIIVITVIIWPPFAHFSKCATFIPGSISVWSDAAMTRGTAQIDLGRQGRNACQFAIKVHALYLPEPDYLNKAHISHN